MEEKNLNKKKTSIQCVKIASVALIVAVVLMYLFIILYSAVVHENNKTSTQGSVLVIDDKASDISNQNTASSNQNLSNELMNRSVYFAGYTDATISKETVVQLTNLPENIDFFIKYVISDVNSGETVYKTDLIPAGQSVPWVPGETLEVGEYELSFLAQPYYLAQDGSYVALTAGNNVINYTISE